MTIVPKKKLLEDVEPYLGKYNYFSTAKVSPIGYIKSSKRQVMKLIRINEGVGRGISALQLLVNLLVKFQTNSSAVLRRRFFPGILPKFRTAISQKHCRPLFLAYTCSKPAIKTMRLIKTPERFQCFLLTLSKCHVTFRILSSCFYMFSALFANNIEHIQYYIQHVNLLCLFITLNKLLTSNTSLINISYLHRIRLAQRSAY